MAGTATYAWLVATTVAAAKLQQVIDGEGKPRFVTKAAPCFSTGWAWKLAQAITSTEPQEAVELGVALSIDDLNSVSGGAAYNGITSKFNLRDIVHVEGHYYVEWKVDCICFKKDGPVYDVKCGTTVLRNVPESDLSLV
jgi:hypothetical protein